MKARGLGWLALACLVALYVVAFATSLGRRVDAGLFRRVSDTDLDHVSWVGYRVLHTVDAASVCLIGGSIVLVGLVRGRSARAVAAAVVLLGSLATTEIVKLSLAPLDRVLAPHRGSKWEGSFPSGTATIAMALALGAVLVAPRALRLATALVGSVYAAATGVALVADAWHYPSDVVAGFLVAAAWCAIALLGLRAWGERADGHFVIRHERIGLYVALGLAAAFCAVLALILVTHPVIVDALRLKPAFAATGVALALLSVAIVGSATVLAREPVQPAA